MIKTELIDIIRTGRFGSVSIGDSKDQLLNKIGEPDSCEVWKDTPDEHSESLLYDCFEFAFFNGKLIWYYNNKLTRWVKYFWINFSGRILG